MSHPFLETSFPVRWSTLTPAAVVPDITEALARATRALDALIAQDRSRLTFASVILAYEDVLQQFYEAWGLVTHLDSVCNSPALRDAHNAMLPEVSGFLARIPLNERLWDLLQTYASSDDARSLDAVRRRAVDELVASFQQQGADLPADQKRRLEAVEADLSRLTQQYAENLLDSTNAWELVLDDVSRLKGLPQRAIEVARAEAEAKGLGTPEAPRYRLTLKAPSLIAVMDHLDDSSIRKQMWEGIGTIGRGGDYDNTALIWHILRLRDEKARLLGKANFADHILERRMAKRGATALAFIEDLHAKVKGAFDREVATLQQYVADTTQQPPRAFLPWEVTYWMEKRRREQFDFDEEAVRPYFAVDGVLAGMFRLAERLFDVSITQRDSVCVTAENADASRSSSSVSAPIEVWHPEVKYYEIRNGSGAHLGSFFTDWHPRDAKRSGGWMNYLKSGRPGADGRDRRPHLGLICGNLTPPVGGAPALLTHHEVCVVFHEFGHLLHQMLGDVDVPSLNGIRVAWDFVELPSQLMENFCWERASLDFFATHYETGARIPDDLFAKMTAVRRYMSAVAMMRQLGLAKLDLELHMHHANADGVDLDELARTILSDYLLPMQPDPPTMARRFSHLFSRPVGYAASYYSYKWAEVLDADAFTRFQKEGVLNPIVGRAFRDTILSRGNSEDPETLFRNFMGRAPDPSALLARAGLV